MIQSQLRKASQTFLVGGKTMSTHNIDYQFLQRSQLPTMYFQPSLPRLPIPLLQRTCGRFLVAVQPILNEEEYLNTQEYVSKFQQNEGMQLQALLKQRDARNKHTSYISEPWFDMYLRDRAPLPLNYNPLVVMKHDLRPEYQAQIVRATNMVISSLRFWRSLREGILDPEVFHLNPKKSDTPQFRKWMKLMPTAFATYAAYAFKAFPLDMSQYHRLFGVSRIPSPEKDCLVEFPDSKHILVMRRGNLYALDVLDADGCILSPKAILSRLQAVLDQDMRSSAAKFPLGVLTSLERNSWAKLRQRLIDISSNNKQLLEREIDSALFCVCLDNEQDPTYNDERPHDLLKNMLAGVGKNRWFDKSVSLLIASDGTTAINFEHSWGDGVAVLRYINEIYKETTQKPFVSTKDLKGENDAQSVRSLVLHLDDSIRNEISNAIQKNKSTMSIFEMDILRYGNLNKKICKQERISPDSVMQLSFQLAYRQAFKTYVGTYESCSTSAFRHGRTEAMRPCTMATRSFCESILRPSKALPSNEELRAMLQECSKIHGVLTKDAAMGQGFDRHLFALKHIANEENMPIPELYNSKAYKKVNYNIISTSTLSSPAILAGSFGPVVHDGLGIGYSIQDEECGAIVTSYKGGADGRKFIQSLLEAFNKICKVLS